NVEQRDAHKRSDRHRAQIADPNVLPHAVVEVKWNEGQHADDHQPRHRLGPHVPVAAGNVAVESKPERQVVGDDDEDRVDGGDAESTAHHDVAHHQRLIPLRSALRLETEDAGASWSPLVSAGMRYVPRPLARMFTSLSTTPSTRA